MVEVFCSDLSPAAVRLTGENALKSGVASRVHAIECDLGNGLDGLFDVVVSNPPYVPTELLVDLPGEVSSYEPRLALDGGADGLDVFRRIVDWASSSLREGGLLACELHEDAMRSASAIAEGAGYSDVRVVKDLVGKDRVLLAVWKG